MSDTIHLTELPVAKELHMIAGWRQWADAGSVSSSLPKYLIKQTKARKIGHIEDNGYYLFQIPGTHHLVRPTVKFEDGFPVSLELPSNEFYYAGDDERGIVIFLGDEPHLKIEQYMACFLEAAKQLNVSRIVGLGGVYGEMPYDKERTVSSTYSQPALKPELDELSVNFSDYEGGASIGSLVCKFAADLDLAYASFYAFVPSYDFTGIEEIGNTIRIENDFMAWLGIMRRINYFLGIDFDLADLENRTAKLLAAVEAKVEELEERAPQLGVRDYMARLSDMFEEVTFDRLSGVWEEELSRLFVESGDEEDE